MTHLLADLEPQAVWEHFYKLTQIPRPSKNESKVCRYIMTLAKKLGLEATMDNAGGDDFGNIVVKVEASPGYENAPISIIQSHVDIVGLPADKKQQPLDLILDGTVLRAKGTTLGADNGIAVAMALTLMTDPTIIHGPLELLFTIDEETGMTGAHTLSDSVLKGKYLVNIDSEEEGTLTIGCAGGNRTLATLPLEWESVPENYRPVRLNIMGLQGGHSGMEINSGRANAGQLAMRFLFSELKNIDIRLVDIEWGSVDNAIPSEAHVTLVVKAEQLMNLKNAANNWEDIFRQEFGRVETNLRLTIDEGLSAVERVLSERSMLNAVRLLLCLPHGVHTMSVSIPGLVETSSNVAVVKTGKEELTVSISQRSSNAPALEAIIAKFEAGLSLGGASFEQGGCYPGWQPDLGSQLLRVCQDTYIDLFGSEANVVALHAGLECGLIGAKYPDLDMISIGPTIIDAHSPSKPDFQPGIDSDTKGERIDTAQMPQFWAYVMAILKNLAMIEQ